MSQVIDYAKIKNGEKMKERAISKMLIVVLAAFIGFIALKTAPVFALSIKEIQVVKISFSDETAVIRTPEKNLQVIKKGDSLKGIGTVVEITDARVVLDANTGRGPETVIIRIKDGKQRVERIRKCGAEGSRLYVPHSSQDHKP